MAVLASDMESDTVSDYGLLLVVERRSARPEVLEHGLALASHRDSADQLPGTDVISS
jgi:hypothetical protein